MLSDLRKIRVYVALVLLAYGGYLWLGLHNTRLLGDDNETTENINGTGGSGGGVHGRSNFYHK